MVLECPLILVPGSFGVLTAPHGQGTREFGAQGDHVGEVLDPTSRRRSLIMLQNRLKMSKRAACRVTGQARNTQRRKPQCDRSNDPDRWLRDWLNTWATTRGQYPPPRLSAFLGRSSTTGRSPVTTLLTALDQITAVRARPVLIRCDNGPQRRTANMFGLSLVALRRCGGGLLRGPRGWLRLPTVRWWRRHRR